MDLARTASPEIATFVSSSPSPFSSVHPDASSAAVTGRRPERRRAPRGNA